VGGGLRLWSLRIKRVVLLGLSLGGVLSWLAQSSLEAFLFGISATNAATYVGVCLGITLMAALAALLPARSAAAISPSRSLAGR
jgi:ABC-type antimicrobial peptide transport system permease subunit